MYDHIRRPGEPCPPRYRFGWRVPAAGLLVAVAFVQGVAYGQGHPTSAAKAAPVSAAHGAVYLLGCDSGKRVELSKFAGTPEVAAETPLGTVSRWCDGKGQTLMTRAAVLFVEDRK